ncbi:NAD(P)H-dependent oxidoreductase [Siccirubricoccus deserti]
MHVLLIACHPRPDSFSRALSDTVRETLTEAGHTVELRDLHAEGFVPVMTAEEHALCHTPAPTRLASAATPPRCAGRRRWCWSTRPGGTACRRC